MREEEKLPAMPSRQPEPAGVRPDAWTELKTLTAARLALGRAGTSLPTTAILDFQLDHARAKDAVVRPWESRGLENWLTEKSLPFLTIHSRARDRQEYLKRPDLGRLLEEESAVILADRVEGNVVTQAASRGLQICQYRSQFQPDKADLDLPRLALVVADGLSSLAVETQAGDFLANFLFSGQEWPFRLCPVVLARQARVALGDEIGQALSADAVLMLVGERPGLSSPDSLGLYLTWKPRRGLQNSDRNCISNIRPQGLDPVEAAARAMELTKNMLARRISGINLKDEGLLGS